MTILAQTYFCRQKGFLQAKGFLPAKRIFTGFYHGKKQFFPPSGKNLPTLTYVCLCEYGVHRLLV